MTLETAIAEMKAIREYDETIRKLDESCKEAVSKICNVTKDSVSDWIIVESLLQSESIVRGIDPDVLRLYLMKEENRVY